MRIFTLRDHRVLLGSDLARLYGVEPRAIMQAVRRNKERFSDGFLFQLTEEEALAINSRSQSVILKWGENLKYLPYAFTQEGIAMLSSVLRSPRAVRANIAIMRAFVRMRRWMLSHEDLARRLEDLESRYDERFRVVFDAIRELTDPPEAPRDRIGFRPE